MVPPASHLRTLLLLGATILTLAAEEPAPREDAPLLAGCRAAVEYSRAAGGQAVLVKRGGRVVFEEYYGGWKAGEAHVLASGTKSFSGAMAAAAVEDGFLKWDEKACETIAEWKDDPLKSKITVRHLLSLTSGLDAGTIGRVPSYAEAVQAPAKFEPGTRFEYGPVPYQVFGELMRRKLEPKKEGVLGYLRRRILNPIGLTTGDWRFDEDDNPQLPSGAFLEAREWAKFGELILNRGRFGDRQVLAWEPLAECFRPGKINPAYGLTFWLGPEVRGQAEVPKDFCMAAGAGKQRLYVLPSHGLVVVHFAARARRFDDQTFLQKLLKDVPEVERTVEGKVDRSTEDAPQEK